MIQQAPAATFAERLRAAGWPILVAAALGVCGMLLFFGPTDNWSWDPSFYYAQMRSPIIDHDLDFRNETLTGSYVLGYTETGLQDSAWPIGPSVLWSPFFLLGHGAVRGLDPAHASGFDPLSLASVALGSLGYGLAGLVLIYAICRSAGDRATALTVTALCGLATPLLFYMLRQPIMAHTTGLFAAALMVWIYLSLAEGQAPDKLSGLLFGVALGLCFLTRWSGLLMAVVPGVYYAAHLIAALRRRAARAAWQVIAQAAIMAGVALLTIAPQLALWYRLHHQIFAMPQTPDAFVGGLWPVNLPKVIFDSNRGILFWCPFVLIGMVGVAFIAERRLKIMAAAVLILQLVLIGYRIDWYSGGGFGARYMIELLPFVAPGFVSLIQRLPGRRLQLSVLIASVAALGLHQLVLLYAVEHMAGWLDMGSYFTGAPLGLRWQWADALRLLRDPALWLAPRPYVGLNRQAVLVNYLAGVRDPHVYLITGMATILTPLLVAGLFVFARLLRKRAMAVLLSAIGAYCVGWAIYLLVV